MDGDLDNGKGSVIETEGRSGGALLAPLVGGVGGSSGRGGPFVQTRHSRDGRVFAFVFVSARVYLYLYLYLCVCTCNLICIFYLYLYPGGMIPSCTPGKVGMESGNNITNTHTLNLRNNTSCVTQPNPPTSQRHPLIWKGLWPL